MCGTDACLWLVVCILILTVTLLSFSVRNQILGKYSIHAIVVYLSRCCVEFIIYQFFVFPIDITDVLPEISMIVCSLKYPTSSAIRLAEKAVYKLAYRRVYVLGNAFTTNSALKQ